MKAIVSTRLIAVALAAGLTCFVDADPFILPAEARKELKLRLADARVKLASYYSLKLSRNERDWREEFVLAKDMGIETLVGEPPLDAFDLIEELCEQYQINVAIHNHTAPSRYWDPETVLKVCRGRSKRIDVRAAFRRPDGSLASFEESRKDPSLWQNRGPLFFPNDDLEHVRKIYERTPFYCHYGFHQTGHTMDYVLRPGESFKRWWTPQGGRWHHLPAYHQGDFMRRLIEEEPRGPAPNHRHFTIHNYGNGRFVYRPNLKAASTDFMDGVYEHQNVVSAEEGLKVKGSGNGHAVIEVRSPYIIVPKVERLETTEDDSEASIVEVEADGTSLSISLDNGYSWQPVSPAEARGRIDLTEHVAGTYGYLLRLNLRHHAEVRRLTITTWVQVAPAVNNFKIYAHCVEDRPRATSPVVITHAWTEGGVERTKQIELEGPGEYEIVAEAKPVDKWIELAVPSDALQEVVQADEPAASGTPDWVEPMRKIHKRFMGERGTFAQFGNSLTDSPTPWY